MKPIRFVLLALTFSLLLVACERPAPAGEIPAPVDNNTEIVPPRTDDAYPGLPLEATTGTPTVAVPTTTEGITETQSIDAGDGSTPETTVTGGEEAAEETPALADGIYVVRAGDTLGQIAFVFGVTVEDIMAANNLVNADVLDVGQQLIIPEEGFAETAVPTPGTTTGEPTPATPAGEEQVHIVQAGDNLYRIGLRYGFTVDELAEYNNLTDVNNLEVGQEILIPPSN